MELDSVLVINSDRLFSSCDVHYCKIEGGRSKNCDDSVIA